MTAASEIQNAVVGFVTPEDLLEHINGNARNAVSPAAAPAWAGIRRDAQVRIDAADDAGSLAEAYRRALVDLETAARVGGIAMQNRPCSDNAVWSVSAGFGGVGIVADGDTLLANWANAVISAIEMELQPDLTAVKLALTIISRTTSDADNALPPGGPGGPAASDALLATAEFPLADLGLTPGGAMLQVMLPLAIPIAVRAGKTYIAVAEAKTSGGALAALGFGQAIVSPTLPSRLNGFYRPSSASADWGGTLPNGYAAAGAWILPKYPSLKQFDTDIGQLKTFMAKVDRSFGQSFQLISSRMGDGTFWGASESHYRWTYGISAGSDVPVGTPIARVASFFELSSGITKVRLTAWSRPTTASQARSYPGTDLGDTRLLAAEKTVADLDVQASPGSIQRVSFPVDEIMVEAGKTYLFQWDFQNDAGANQAVGIARHQRALGLSPQQRGWYDDFHPISPPAALTWEIDKFLYVPPGDSKKVIADTRDIIADAAAAATGLAVTLNGVFRRLHADLAFRGSLRLDAPAGGTVTDEIHTITEAFAPHRLFAGPGALAHSNVSNVVVKDVETDGTLVAGTDYLLDAVTGGVCLSAGQSDRLVKISYTWSERRYDMLCLNAESLRLVVVRGTGRERDAGEFLPTPDDSALMPLFYARVATGFDTVLIPLWYLDGPVHRDLLQIRAADFEQARGALRKTLAKAHAGRPIMIAAMGDSIISQECDSISVTSPNGPYRERTPFFLENIGSDKVAQLALYDNDDGAGQVHTRTSKAWAAALALTQWGSAVTLNNFASARTWSGIGTGSGADPLLRTAVWATKPDVLFIHYGMNEIGSDHTEGNLRNLIERAFAHGIEVLVFGCPRPSSTNFLWTFPALRKTWRATRRAATFYSTAYRMRAAYYDPARLVEEDYVGAMGLAPIDFCSANGWNHPGIHEHDVDCAEIHAMLCG